jgi:hypothetical protein
LDIQAHGAAFRYDGTGEWQAGESGAHPVALKGYLQALAAEDTDRLDALSCALDQAIHGDALLGEDPVSGQASLGTLNLILKCLLELQARVGTQAMAATRA